MTTGNDNQSAGSERITNKYVSSGEIAAGVTWFAFYLAIVSISIVSQLNIGAMEFAAR